MLQDLAFGKLENEYRSAEPTPDSCIICIRGNEILVCRDEHSKLQLPRLKDSERWSQVFGWRSWDCKSYQYVFRMQNDDYFLWMGESGEIVDGAFHYEPVRRLREPESKDCCFAIMTAWHLFLWYRSNRFCGCCGKPMVHDGDERMVRCLSCGNTVYPRISPAVIVAVTDGDNLLLTKYAGRTYNRFALIAGYTEIGETLEQTVQREVMEEVGLKVKNIRYYKSQPWGVDGNVLMGFFCDLDGDSQILLDQKELSFGEWFHRSCIPARDDGISLTREMIRIFEEHREP